MCVLGTLCIFIHFRNQRNKQWIEDQQTIDEDEKEDRQAMDEGKKEEVCNDDVHVPGENNVDLVKIWLDATVGLPQYYATFITNDYDSLDFISNISSKEELSEIGIKSKGHQTQLMAHIKKLKDAKEDKNEELHKEPPMIQEREGVNQNKTKTCTTQAGRGYVTKSEEFNGKPSRRNDVCDV
eukprot:803786_1